MAKPLTRQLFELSREIEFFTEKELSMQIGHPPAFWYVGLVKELIDNALDACEVADTAPQISVQVTAESFEVRDNGPGIPFDTVRRSLDYLTRVSDKQFYVSPTRGQMGNALKTVWAAPFVATGLGKVEVEAAGERATVTTRLDRITQRPAIEYDQAPGEFVKTGSIVRVYWPRSSGLEESEGAGSYRNQPPTVEELVRNFSTFNPHARFEVVTESKQCIYEPTDPAWRKWRTDMPTSAHWYTPETLRDLIAGYIVAERDAGSHPRTVREFVSEFRGLSATSKQKAIADGFSRSHLHDLVVDGDLDMTAIAALLAKMRAESKPVAPQALGRLGEDHFRRWLLRDDDVIAESFAYSCQKGNDKTGLPYVHEFAFGAKKPDRPADIFVEKGRTLITGMNWTPSLGVPAAEIDEALRTAKIDYGDPVVLAMHLVKPRFDFTDRGKTRIAL